MRVTSAIPRYHATSAAPPVDNLLRVDDRIYPRIDRSQVTFGDIGFVYKPNMRSYQQAFVYWAQRLCGYEPAAVIHPFVVVGMREPSWVLVADAAIDTGVTLSQLNLANDGVVDDFDPNMTCLFLRVRDPDVADRLATIAWNWARLPNTNFSAQSVFAAPFRSKSLASADVQQICSTVDQAPLPRPMTRPDGITPHRMMCAEFVAHVGMAATIAVDRGRRGIEGPASRDDLAALRDGPAGDAFALDPRAHPPAALYKRLSSNPALEVVGFVEKEEPPAVSRLYISQLAAVRRWLTNFWRRLSAVVRPHW